MLNAEPGGLVTGRYLFRLLPATILCGAFAGLGLRAQTQGQPPPTTQAPAAPQGPLAPEKYKNIQTLKTIRADQLRDTMEYFTAALGVQCGTCHVQTPDGWNYESDDRPNKKTARKMIEMVNWFNSSQKDITLTCATCHHGRNQPERTPPLAVEMTPAEAAAAAARAAQFAARSAQGASGAPATPGAPAAEGARGQGGRGGPPRPTETVDQVIDKFVEAMGGQAALSQAKTRVLHGTATTRDLVTTPITVQEKATGEYRIDVDSKPQPTVRVFDGKTGWIRASGNVRDLEGIQIALVSRPSEFGLPLAIKQRYQTVTVGRYGNLDGVDTIGLTARVNADVVEQLQFERQTGLLKRRTVQTRTPFGNLVEQVDYSDYRDGAGIKTPFQVKYTNWREATTEKFTDAKINAPIDDGAFTKK
jgi:hypothetical protein